jgi:hypothetical protein
VSRSRGGLAVARPLTSTEGVGTGHTPSPTSEASYAQAHAVGDLLGTSSLLRDDLTLALDELATCRDLNLAVALLQSTAGIRQHLRDSANRIEVDQLDGGEAVKADLVVMVVQSAVADSAYLAWGMEEKTAGCSPDTPTKRRADADAARATLAKQQLVAVWNPVATHYGLASYTADEL